ncbi:unnamed protein product [Polarella glacialis]|uniref:Uncharacterized protein n=1 Tax=Polarella glacialis TaxID=89957 RepID=A0A813J5Z2_POLGL|nr:unnamed protein product [Polarella glacialis]|mmetsp:Transcript_54192/g.87562  ORF Transcript_54192/g.87562 Transcript_54192/m.87562 type:complete len:241 (+) Transcript_54192:85-807(+)
MARPAARRPLRLVELTILLGLSMLLHSASRQCFVGGVAGRVPRASGRPLTQVQGAADAEVPGGFADRLLGAWRYQNGAYEIKMVDGKLYFQEANMAGQLSEQGEWLVAELPASGTIRLKLDAEGSVVSNFKVAGTEEWGDSITAVKEWETLGTKASALEKELDLMHFESASADGSVVVEVDGRQRPASLRISPEAASASDLGARILEANNQAAAASLAAMSERLRELYATHLGATLPERE